MQLCIPIGYNAGWSAAKGCDWSAGLPTPRGTSVFSHSLFSSRVQHCSIERIRCQSISQLAVVLLLLWYIRFLQSNSGSCASWLRSQVRFFFFMASVGMCQMPDADEL